jgi:hypothetical protein
MFDMSKLGDMAKIAGEAKKMQAVQEEQQRKQLEVLNKISRQMDEVLNHLKNKGQK